MCVRVGDEELDEAKLPELRRLGVRTTMRSSCCGDDTDSTALCLGAYASISFLSMATAGLGQRTCQCYLR